MDLECRPLVGLVRRDKLPTVGQAEGTRSARRTGADKALEGKDREVLDLPADMRPAEPLWFHKRRSA